MNPEEELIKRIVRAWRDEAYRGNLRLTFLNKDMTSNFVDDMDSLLRIIEKRGVKI